MKMLKNKVQKGSHGYLAYRKKVVLLETICMFALSLLIFFGGYLYNGTKANLLTIVAVLGLLPASKSMVSLIMYFRTPKFNENYYEKFCKEVDENKGLYELYFTSYSKNFPVNSMICKKDALIGFSEFEKCDVKALEEHLETILKQNGFKDITIKIFSDPDKYKERAAQIANQQNSESLAKLMTDIIL